VSKGELLGTIWPDTHVSDGILKARVAEIRRVLGDTANPPTFIETCPAGAIASSPGSQQWATCRDR
jgi:DNA-binding winged helix-turn-helix (wHTH) protein